MITQLPMPENMAGWIDLYERCFQEPPSPFEIPPLFCTIENNGEVIGFMSGFMTSATELYLQRIGMIHGKRRTVAMWHEIAGFWRGQGVRHLIGCIRCDNRRAIIMSMRTGWTIYGFKADTNGTSYVLTILSLG